MKFRVKCLAHNEHVINTGKNSEISRQKTSGISGRRVF